MFMAALFTIAKIQKQHKCPSTNNQVKKLWYTEREREREKYYSVIKNTEILPFAATWTDLANIMLSEISWKEKVKYSVITYIWNLKNKTNG